MKTLIQILQILFASFFVMTAKAQSEFDISPVVDEITGTTSPLNSSYSDVRERFRGIECFCFPGKRQEYYQSENTLSKCGLLMYFTEGLLSMKIISLVLSVDSDTSIFETIVKAVSLKEGEELENEGVQNGIQLYILKTTEKIIVVFYNKNRLIAINGTDESLNKNKIIMDFIPLMMEESMESTEH